MRRAFPFLMMLVVLAGLCGWLLSHLNFIGRLGVNLLHTEYQFLRTWWKGGVLVLFVWLLFWALHHAANRLPVRIARVCQIAGAVLALLGLLVSYQDFRNNISHRIIGERFHVGVYLFWIGWLVIAFRAWLIVDKQKTSTVLHLQSGKTTFVDN